MRPFSRSAVLVRNRKLIDLTLRALPAISEAIGRGEAVIELVG
jgi:hypothetical protein